MHIGARWGMDGMDGMDDSFRKGSALRIKKVIFHSNFFFLLFLSFFSPPCMEAEQKQKQRFACIPWDLEKLGGKGCNHKYQLHSSSKTGGFRKIV